MMRLSIDHRTNYRYGTAASYALLQLRVQPQTSAIQTVLNWEMQLQGAHWHAGFTDQHGNHVDLVELSPGARDVEIRVSGEVETLSENGMVGPHSLAMPLWFYERQTPLTRPGPLVEALLAETGRDRGDDLGSLHRLSSAIRERVGYLTGTTDTTTTAEVALASGSGVCQDHAHIFLSAARRLGFAARYVSGYLMMDDRVEQDASHAWAEAFIPDLGWVGFDISNAISPDQRYVQLAYGLDYTGAAPTAGIVIGAQEENLVVSIQVQQ